MVGKIEPPVISPLDLSEEALEACNELIAELLRHGSEVINVRFNDTVYEQTPIGNFEISVRRLLD